MLSLRRIRNRTLQYPEIEKPLVGFVNTARSLKMPVACSVIQSKALSLRDDAVKDCEDDSRKERLNAFKATEGWVAAFLKRNGLRSLKVEPCSTGAPSPRSVNEVASFSNQLSEFSVDAVYTVDHTTLFYRLLPQKSYVTANAGRPTLLATSGMSVDDRVSMYICCNASGTRKVPMTLIGREQAPKCFGKDRSPVPYFSQQNACADSNTFQPWFNDVFLPYVQSNHACPVALVVNDNGSHIYDIGVDRGQVKLFALPPTSNGMSYQPMNYGVVSAFKTQYRYKLLKRTVENMDTIQQRREMASAMRFGTQGICEGYDANLLDAAQMVKSVWSNLSQTIIAQSWMKANILPVVMNQQLARKYGAPDASIPVVQDGVTMGSLCTLVKQLIGLKQLEGCGIKLPDISDPEVGTWALVEHDALVCEAFNSDKTAFVQTSADVVGHAAVKTEVDAFAGGGSSVMEDDDANNQGVQLPPAPVISFAFKDLEMFASDVGLSDAMFHLRQAKQALLTEKERSCREMRVVGDLSVTMASDAS